MGRKEQTALDDYIALESVEEEYEETIEHCSEPVEYTFDGVKVKFPFEAYPCQQEMMSNIIAALNSSSSNALLESPTGSGKSFSVLCGVLGWLEHQKNKILSERQKIGKEEKKLEELINLKDYEYFEENSDNDFISTAPVNKKFKDADDSESSDEKSIFTSLPKIYITSRTHKQIAQLVKELRRTSYSPKFVVLGSRMQYCINERVRKSKDLNEACRESCKTGSCSFFNKQSKKAKYNNTTTPNCDIEELVKKCKTDKSCPYFTARAAVEGAEVIFGPYNYLLDPVIREAMGVTLNKDIVIIDEAHNIEDTCREAGSFEISDDSLEQINTELRHICDTFRNSGDTISDLYEAHTSQGHLVAILLNWLRHIDSGTGKVRRDFETSMSTWQEASIGEELASLGITFASLQAWSKQLQKIVEKSNETQKEAASNNDHAINGMLGDLKGSKGHLLLSTGSMQILKSFYSVATGMLMETGKYLGSYRMVKYQATKVDANGKKLVFTLGLWCLDPEVTFRQLELNTKSVILTSGTLSPIDTFSSELGSKFAHQLEAMHIISKEQTWVGCIPVGPEGCTFLGNYKTMDSFQYQDDLCRAIQKVCSVVPAGILCFLPSYAFMEKLIKRMQNIGIYDSIAKQKKIFSEPRQGTPKDFELLMKNYYRIIGDCKGKEPNQTGLNGALLFAIFRGKISEGLDLKDDNCRAVIPVGIPYPAYKDPKVMLKREFNDAQVTKKLLKGQHWYEIQAFRALNQALGRCIRHKYDWGAIILLEQRFTIKRNIDQLSKWVRGRLNTHGSFEKSIDSLNDFIRRNRSLPMSIGSKHRGGDLENVDDLNQPST